MSKQVLVDLFPYAMRIFKILKSRVESADDNKKLEEIENLDDLVTEEAKLIVRAWVEKFYARNNQRWLPPLNANDGAEVIQETIAYREPRNGLLYDVTDTDLFRLANELTYAFNENLADLFPTRSWNNINYKILDDESLAIGIQDDFRITWFEENLVDPKTGFMRDLSASRLENVSYDAASDTFTIRVTAKQAQKLGLVDLSTLE